MSEDLKSRFDDRLGLAGSGGTADQVWNSMTGGNDIRNSLALDLVEIRVIEAVDLVDRGGWVVFLLRPNPSSEDTVIIIHAVTDNADLKVSM
jgi:hypothetical protein